MAQVSRGIGWSQESNLLYQILKQLNKLTSIMFGLKPKYKVFTALLTQNGGDTPSSLNDEPLTIGVTYQITDQGGSGWDFTNVGAPNNNIGTYFVATGINPNSWGDLGVSLNFNIGAPVVTVLENTIGNIWFNYEDVGIYGCQSNNLFINSKTFILSTPNNDANAFGITVTNQLNESVKYISPFNNSFVSFDGGLYNTSIEIRVYN